MKIAILGAESTGKTQLAQALSAHWNALGQSALWVPEVLREWCDRESRTPHQHEQWDIVQEQATRVLQAPAVDWLIADTTPLMTAIYSELLFADRTLYDFALEHQRHYDITLVDRHLTVVLNGQKIIDNQPVLGCTGGALSSDESKPGPFYLQGDHEAVDYKNIVVRPVVK